MSASSRFPLLTELAGIFWTAMKETPGQMAAPFVAFWREVLKWGDPKEGIFKQE